MKKKLSLTLLAFFCFAVFQLGGGAQLVYAEVTHAANGTGILIELPYPLTSSTRHYEKDLPGLSGAGYVTVEVTETIFFSITITEGTEFFCNVPWYIVQDGITYNITISPVEENDILIAWNSFDGCGEIAEGVTAAGTMSEFPASFDIGESFRIYCGIWVHGDYFDIASASPFPPGSTTSSTSFPSTTSLPTTTSTVPQSPCLVEYIYGEHAAETEALRFLRDNILAHTSEGRKLLGFYYQLSPAIVTAIQKDKALEHAIKKVIDELMGFLSYPVPSLSPFHRI